MAKVTLNPMIEEIQGKLGGYVFRRTRSGKMYLSKVPDMSRVKWSKAQKESRERFKKAVAYAQAAMADPKVRSRYEKKAEKEGRRARDLAIADYLKGKNLLTAGK